MADQGNRNQHIVQVLYSGLGGHGNVAFSLANEARKQHDSRRFSMIFVGVEPVLNAYVRDCETAGMAHRFVKARRGLPLIRWALLFMHLVSLRPTTIILHSVKMILPAWVYATLFGAKLVAVEHQANDLKLPSEWKVSRLLMRLAHAIILLTDDYYQSLKAGLGSAWRDHKVTVIPNGIDTDSFCPNDSRPRQPESPVRIGMASRLATNKRHDDLIKAFTILCAQYPETRWQLTIAGDGETRAGLERQVQNSSAASQIVFEGFLDQQQLRDWFGTLDIYVHASDGETLSTSLLQALAMKLPIVGSDVAGITNLLRQPPNECGLVAPNGAPENFAAAIHAIWIDQALSNQLKTNARSIAVSRYSQANMYQKYCQIMDQL